MQKELESQAQRRKMETELIEEKNAHLSDQVSQLTVKLDQKTEEVSRLNSIEQRLKREMEELQMQVLTLKS